MAPEAIHKVRDVFGIGRDVPLNYVNRLGVDQKLIESLTRDKHVVIYGSSKQGKTTLRKHCLEDKDYILVACLNTMTISDLNAGILKAAGYRIEQSQSKSISGAWKYNAEFVGEGKVPFFAKAGGKAGLAHESVEKTDTLVQRLEIDLGDVNDIIAALMEISFNKYIILEDFHYLPIDTQKNFAFALKSYHENSKLCFIVIGVWRDENRLVYYNGDLTSRVIGIDADQWRRNELSDVVEYGEKLLNIKFDRNVIEKLLDSCFESVAIVQEACARLCAESSIVQTSDEYKQDVGSKADIVSIVRQIVEEQAARYSAFINNFAEGFQQTELEMYKWLACVIISATPEELESGLRRAQISFSIKSRHPEGTKLNEGNITQALQNAANLQISKGIRPLIFDYDQTTRVLTIVDRGFLIWMGYQDGAELRREIGIE